MLGIEQRGGGGELSNVVFIHVHRQALHHDLSTFDPVVWTHRATAAATAAVTVTLITRRAVSLAITVSIPGPTTPRPRRRGGWIRAVVTPMASVVVRGGSVFSKGQVSKSAQAQSNDIPTRHLSAPVYCRVKFYHAEESVCGLESRRASAAATASARRGRRTCGRCRRSPWARRIWGRLGRTFGG